MLAARTTVAAKLLCLLCSKVARVTQVANLLRAFTDASYDGLGIAIAD